MVVDERAECVAKSRLNPPDGGTRQTHVWLVSEATEVLPLSAVTLYSDF